MGNTFGKFDGPFCIELLKNMPFPEDLCTAGIEGIKDVWHTQKLDEKGYAGAENIAQTSVGLKDGKEAAKLVVEWFAKEVAELTAKIKEVNELLK